MGIMIAMMRMKSNRPQGPKDGSELLKVNVTKTGVSEDKGAKRQFLGLIQVDIRSSEMVSVIASSFIESLG